MSSKSLIIENDYLTCLLGNKFLLKLSQLSLINKVKLKSGIIQKTVYNTQIQLTKSLQFAPGGALPLASALALALSLKNTCKPVESSVRSGLLFIDSDIVYKTNNFFSFYRNNRFAV